MFWEEVRKQHRTDPKTPQDFLLADLSYRCLKTDSYSAVTWLESVLKSCIKYQGKRTKIKTGSVSISCVYLQLNVFICRKPNWKSCFLFHMGKTGVTVT